MAPGAPLFDADCSDFIQNSCDPPGTDLERLGSMTSIPLLEIRR
ncbi:MAG: hypothetical protein ACOCXK_01495 [Rhodosalinus sp.]